MSQINQEIIDVLINAHECFGRQPDRVAYFEREGGLYGGQGDPRRLRYIVVKDDSYFGRGYSIYDNAYHVGTFDSALIESMRMTLVREAERARREISDAAEEAE